MRVLSSPAAVSGVMDMQQVTIIPRMGRRISAMSQKTCRCGFSLSFEEKVERSFKMRYIIIGALLCLFATHVMAQSDTLTRQSHDLRGVEVVARHQATAPVQTLTAQNMLTMGISSLSKALSHMAGITLRDYGGAGGLMTVSVRGIGSRHTAVLYDGIALSDCQTGEIDLSRYSLDNVESLQLVIGDGDDIFQPARNTSAAASLYINNLQTPGAKRRPHVKARLTYGSWNTLVPSLYYGQSLTDKLSLSVMGEYTHSDNDYPFTLYNGKLRTREHRVNSNISAGHVEANALWKITDHQQVSGKVYYYDNNRNLPGIVHLYTQENAESLHEQNAFAQMSYLGELSDKWSLQAHMKYNWAESVYRNDNTASAVPSSKYTQREGYGSASLLYSPTTWLSVDYAIDYFQNRLNSDMTTYSKPSRHSLLQSLSGKLRRDRLTVVGRLLWSNYFNHVEQGEAGADAHRLSPSFSVAYKLLRSEELYVRLFWKDIFRMPTFNELYYYHLGSTTLKPEKTSQWNLGVTYDKQIGPCEMHFTVDGYVNHVRDKIISIPYNMFVWQTMNMSKARVFGIDLTTQGRWNVASGHAIEITGNYSWQRAQNRTNPQSEYYNNQIAYVPEHTFSATLTWLNPWVNIAYGLNGTDERWTTNGHAESTRLAGYAEMDLNAWHKFAICGSWLTLRAQMMNLADKQYEIVAHYPMPGRSWRITLEYQF